MEREVNRQRVKVLRKPGFPNYPYEVCDTCGRFAAEDCKKRVEEYIDFTLGHCGVCGNFTNVASTREYGDPTFYTYRNGAPVLQGG